MRFEAIVQVNKHTHKAGNNKVYYFLMQLGDLYVVKHEQNRKLGLFCNCILKNAIKILHGVLFLNPYRLTCHAF